MAVPVTLDDAKCQLRHYDEDITAERQSEIRHFIADAASWVERYTGHIFVARDVTEQFYGPSIAHLHAWPINASAPVEFAYATSAGITVPVPGLMLDLTRRPARLTPPRLPRDAQSYGVTVRAGYEPDDLVPGNLRRAILVLIAGFDADREGGDLFRKAEAAAKNLCREYRLRRI